MATRAQKTKVGLFLAASLLITAVGIALISGLTRGHKAVYLIEFHESVLGLYEGGLVVYLGVEVGTIKDITVTNDNLALAKIEIVKEKVTLREGVEARLSIYSLAMGTMCIILEGGDPNGPELPEGSLIRAKKSKFESVSSEIEVILEDLSEITEGIRTGLSEMKKGELRDFVQNADGLVSQSRELVDSAQETLDTLGEDAHLTMENCRSVMTKVDKVADSVGKLATTMTEKIEPLEFAETQQELLKTLQAIRQNTDRLADQLEATGSRLDVATKSVLHETDNIEYSLRDTLETLNASLEAVLELVKYLEQDPSALIRGKGRPKGGD